MLVALAMAPATAVAEVRVTGKVVHTGFPWGGVDCYRPGAWCPVLVSLQNVGTTHLTGRLVLRQRDKDGDVIVAETVLTLTAGGQARPYRLDFLARQPGAAGTFVIGLYNENDRLLPVYDDRGNPHEALPAPQATELSEDDTLVLDLSSRPISWLDALSDGSRKLLKQPMIVARLRPEDLPDRWYTLQAVQAVIWDNPDVTRLGPQQAQALMDYVRAGGTLVVAAGRTADTLAGSILGRILPVTVRGTESVPVLQQVWQNLLRGPDDPELPPEYVKAITVARARAKPSATPVCSVDALQIDVVTRARWGSGVVVFVAAGLRDLFSIANDPGRFRFLREVLGLLRMPPKEDLRVWTQQNDLYEYMHGEIGFEAVGGLFLVFVVLFVAGYILLATAATWGWLRRRSALQHCWLVFALVASASSALSVAAVQLIRGVGTELRQMCVVDVSVPVDATQRLQAQGVAYFGLRTSTHTRLDVRLGSTQADDASAMHRCYLHPLPSNERVAEQRYVAPENYYLRAGQAMMEAVPVRATLKRLQGYWFGELEGRFSAMIEADADGWLSERSWVRNDLGVDLKDCWLLVSRAKRKAGREGGEGRADQVYVYQIDRTLKSGAGPFQIGRVQPADFGKRPALESLHEQWAGRFMTYGVRGRGRNEEKPRFEMGRFHTALMLLTTLDEYTEYSPHQRTKLHLDRSHGLHLDRCHLLTNDTAMVIGFADTPGPVRLEIRPSGDKDATWRPVSPEQSHTMFRFMIPVRNIPRRREGLW